jgi:hypothetical protein
VQLDATISINDFNLLPQGARTVSLTGPNTNISWLIANFVGPPNPWTGSRSAVATLQPGQYRFFVDLYSFQGGFQPMTASVPSYNVTLTALPEPAAAGLIVLALGGTMRRRR